MTTVIDLNFCILRSAVLTLNNVTATGEAMLTQMRVCPTCKRYACVDAADLAEHSAKQHREDSE